MKVTGDWRHPQSVEVFSMFDLAETDPPPIRPNVCGDRGPYIVTGRGRYKDVDLAVLCTRPAGHDGNHQLADWRLGPSHEWNPQGGRVRPK